MTKANATLLRRIEARVRQLRPELAAALLASLARVQDVLTERELRDVVRGQASIESLFTEAVIARAFLPQQRAIRAAVEEAVRLTVPDFPMRVSKGEASVLFDYLNPRVIVAIRELETPALATLTEMVKETTRAFVENGLRDGRPPSAVARQLRSVIGIAPHQAVYVANLEAELRNLDAAVLDRKLRDHRFDKTILRAIDSGKPLTEAQVEQITSAYRRRFTAFNTDVVTRQTTLDAYRVGQRLAWDGAIETGLIDGDDLWRTWVHFDPQANPRPEHQAKDGETVRYDQPYSDGTYTAGIGAWGCHCNDRYSTRRPSGTNRGAFT